VNRRATILLTALVVVFGGVAWLVFGLSSGAGARSERITHSTQTNASSADEAAHELGEDTSRALEPGATKPAERARAEPRPDITDDPRADPELRAAQWVEGRVEYAPNTPADEDAYVVAKGRNFENRPLFRGKVAPDGTFRVAFARDTQVGWLQISARYNFLVDDLAVRPAKPPKDIVLHGKLGGCVRGRITLAANALDFLSDVKKGEVSVGEHEFDFFTIGRTLGRIEDDLTYEVGGLEPAAGLNLLLKARGIVPYKKSDVAIQVGRATIVDLAPEMGIRLSGRVVDAKGDGIFEARVSAKQKGERERTFFSLPEYAVTKEDGAFELVGVEEGDVDILAQKQGFEPRIEILGPMARGAERRDLRLVLGEGLAISGRVEFPAGKPAWRARVSALDENADDDKMKFLRALDSGAIIEREPVETAADGSFKITGLTPGAFTITAEAWVNEGADNVADETDRARKVRRKGIPWSGRVDRVTSGTSDVVVALLNGETIRGRVVDSDGKPIERFVVTAAPESDSAGYSSEIKQIERAFRDKDGRFALEGLRTCGWSIGARAKNHLDADPIVITVPGANQALHFTLLRQARLSGVVFDPDNKPIAKAKVVCALDSGQWWMGGTSAKTNDKGEFTLSQVPLGAIRLHAEANGFARGEALRFELGHGATKADLALFVAKPGAIRGVVKRSDGSPDAARFVAANEIDGRWDKRVQTDAEGKFALEGLGPGRYKLVTAEHKKQKIELPDASSIEVPIDEPDGTSTIVAVRAGEVVSVTLAAKRALSIRMHGRITVPNGRAQSLTVTHVGNDEWSKGVTAVVGEDGAYELRLAQAGSHRVEIERESGGRNARWIVQVPEGPDFQRDFAFPAGSIAGRVVDSKGEPVAKYNVRAALPGSRDALGDAHSLDAVTDENGAFTIDGLAEGTYTVEALGAVEWWEDSKKRGRARVDGVKVEGVEPVRDLVLALASMDRVSGTVRSTSGAALPYVEVFAFDEHGHVLSNERGTTSNSAGKFTLRDVLPGRVFLYARTVHSAGKASVVATPESPTDIDIVLHPASDLTVLVQDATGAPTFAPLEIVDVDGRHFEEIQPLTRFLEAPLGARAFPSLPAGKYTVRAALGGTATPEKTVLISEGGRADVELR